MYRLTNFYNVKRSEQLFQQLNERYKKSSNKYGNTIFINTKIGFVRRLKNKEKKNKVKHLLLLKKFFFQLNIKPA